MEYSLDRKIRWETRFDSANREPLQVIWNRRIKKRLVCIYTQIGEVCQSESRIPAADDISRLVQHEVDYFIKSLSKVRRFLFWILSIHLSTIAE